MQSFRKGRKGQFHSVYSIFRFRVAANPVKNVKYDKTQSQEHVELERIAQAIAACGDNLEYRCILALGRYQGCRPSEMNNLKFDDFKKVGTGILIHVCGKTGPRDVPMFPEFLPYYEELFNHRKEGQVYVFAHCRKYRFKDFRNVGTSIRKKMEKAGVKKWALFFDSLRGSCITDKENLRRYTVKQMDAMFGHREDTRQGHYIHDMPEENYAALGGLSDPVAVLGGSAKNSPLDSPYLGGISGIFAYLNDLAERRMTFSDLCKMLCEERGFDVELFQQVAAVNPAVGKMSSFINSLLLEVWDDTPRKVSWLYLVWKCSHVAGKAAMLLM